MAATVAPGRLTRDVDVSSLDSAVAAEAAAIAAEEHLPPTWLNASAAPWVPTPEPAPEEASPGLTVRYAPPEHLLAMKIVAHRARDLDDIRALVDLLGLRGAGPEAFERILRSAYPAEGELQQVLGVPDAYLNDEIRLLAGTVAAATRSSGSG